MIGSILQKLDSSMRPFFPVVTGFFFVLLSALPLPFPYIGAIEPALGLAVIFYWAIYRPDLLRPIAVFGLGLLNDVIHLLPIGLSAFIFICVYQLALSHQRYFMKQVFFMLWSGFAVLSFLASFVTWCAMSLYEGVALPIVPVLMQYAMTLVFFPLPAWVLIKVQRKFLSQG